MADVKVYVCTNKRVGLSSPSCGGRGSLEMLEKLQSYIEAEALDIELEPIVCLGQCIKGPTLRAVPKIEYFYNAELTQYDEVCAWLRGLVEP